MIDWISSFTSYGTNEDNYRKLSSLVVICDRCNKIGYNRLRLPKLIDKTTKQMIWYCLECGRARAKAKLKIISTNAWLDAEKAKLWVASRNTDEYKENQRQKALERYNDTVYHSKVIDANRKNLSRPEVKSKLAAKTGLWWQNQANRDLMNSVRESLDTPEWRLKISNSMKLVWTDPTYRERGMKHLAILLSKMDASIYEKIRISAKKHYEDEEVRLLSSARTIDLWKSEAFRIKVLDGFAKSSFNWSECSKKIWLNDEYRNKVLGAIKKRWADIQFKKKMLGIMREMLDRPEVRQKLRDSSTKRWLDPETREKLFASVKRVSNLQAKFYSILDDIGISYFREYDDKPDDPECSIGPYSFDCVIHRENQKTLLIEIQGDYWHNLTKNVVRDNSKISYINNNFGDRYELKVLWEHEFICKDKVITLVKSWVGLPVFCESIDFKFSEVKISIADRKDANLLLSKYHYLSNGGRGGIIYGAYADNILIGVVVYSAPIRQNHDANITRELSRFCIHPSYQKKNFASWFISRTLKLLPAKYSKIVSYSDMTFNHVGTIYKASNFILDGELTPDYWYVTVDGWVMHKKTMYNHAVKLAMKENEFAELNDYQRVYGKKKFRFVYNR